MKKYSIKKKAALIAGAFCACLLIFYLFKIGIISTQPWSAKKQSSSLIVIDPNAYYPVTDVIDGDTFKANVNGRTVIVRVLGMNTPETVDPRKPVECYGPQASAEGKLLLDGRRVRLVENPHRGLFDMYGRYLLYVYRDDGLFYNEFMIQEGFAREYTVGSAYSFQAEFRAAQAVAQKAGKGLWSACAATITATTTGPLPHSSP